MLGIGDIKRHACIPSQPPSTFNDTFASPVDTKIAMALYHSDLATHKLTMNLIFITQGNIFTHVLHTQTSCPPPPESGGGEGYGHH